MSTSTITLPTPQPPRLGSLTHAVIFMIGPTSARGAKLQRLPQGYPPERAAQFHFPFPPVTSVSPARIDEWLQRQSLLYEEEGNLCYRLRVGLVAFHDPDDRLMVDPDLMKRVANQLGARRYCQVDSDGRPISHS